MQNIVINLDTLDNDRLSHAIEIAELGNLIKSLPRGLETEVGERGILFSGGQIQRILFARAIYKNKQCYILDEFTSALDYGTATKLINGIKEFGKDKLVFMITHQRELIPKESRVISIDQLTNGT